MYYSLVDVPLGGDAPKSKGWVTAHELMADRAGAWLLAAML